MSNAKTEIAQAMSTYGITPPDQIVIDGKIHRFGRKKSSWYVFFNGSAIAGKFGDWKMGINEKFIESKKSLTPMERKRLVQEMRAAAVNRERELQAKYVRVAKKCASIWEGAGHESLFTK